MPEVRLAPERGRDLDDRSLAESDSQRGRRLVGVGTVPVAEVDVLHGLHRIPHLEGVDLVRIPVGVDDLQEQFDLVGVDLDRVRGDEAGRGDELRGGARLVLDRETRRADRLALLAVVVAAGDGGDENGGQGEQAAGDGSDTHVGTPRSSGTRFDGTVAVVSVFILYH